MVVYGPNTSKDHNLIYFQERGNDTGSCKIERMRSVGIARGGAVKFNEQGVEKIDTPGANFIRFPLVKLIKICQFFYAFKMS